MAALALALTLLVGILGVVLAGHGSGAELFAGPIATFGVQLPLVLAFTVVAFAVGGLYGPERGRLRREKLAPLAAAVTLAWALTGVVQPLVPAARELVLSEIALAWAAMLLMVLIARTLPVAQRPAGVAELEPHRPAKSDASRKRVLVIGGAGFIGSALLPRLVERGWRVRVLDRLLYGAGPLGDLLENPDVELVQADYRQLDRLVAALDGVDAVVHLGGLVGDPACSIDEELTTEVNLDSTRVIAELAKGQGVRRFVFASSCSVYGASDDLLDETSRLNPVSLYGRSKIASENVLFEMAEGGFAPTMLRFGTVYGLSRRPRFDLVVNLLAAKAVTEGRITVFGGDQWRPFVHVEDAARAVVAALEAPAGKVRNEIFNVGSDEQNATLGDVGRLIARIVPEAEYVDSGQDGDRRNYRVDFSKIRTMLDFTPAWELEAGVRQVVDALRSGAIGDYRDPLYSNIRFLSEGRAPRFLRVRGGWAVDRIGGDVTRSSKALADAREEATNKAVAMAGKRTHPRQ
jgi:nucleoside-diphosphate-sugar epimerase